jgi:hypothetical protein
MTGLPRNMSGAPPVRYWPYLSLIRPIAGGAVDRHRGDSNEAAAHTRRSDAASGQQQVDLPAGTVVLGKDTAAAVGDEEGAQLTRINSWRGQVADPQPETAQQLLSQLIIQHRHTIAVCRAAPEQPVEDPPSRTPPAPRHFRLMRRCPGPDIQPVGPTQRSIQHRRRIALHPPVRPHLATIGHEVVAQRHQPEIEELPHPRSVACHCGAIESGRRRPHWICVQREWRTLIALEEDQGARLCT